jgi:Ca-activated chloride channel homolog
MTFAALGFAWLALLALPAMFLMRRSTRIRRRMRRELTGDMGAYQATVKKSSLGYPTAAVLVLVALCRPQWGQDDLPGSSKGLDVVVALDVSRSMLADDLSPTRLAAAKAAIAALLQGLEGDRIGLVAFAGSAFLVCPLTQDYNAFASMLNEVGTRTMPLGGTSIERALIEARRALGSMPERSKVLILVSDGEDHAGDLAAAGNALRDADILVISVAAATLGGGVIPLGDGEFVRDSKGHLVVSRLKMEPLTTLATTTGGYSTSLETGKTSLESVFKAASDVLERKTFESVRRQPVERFQWPLGMAVLIVLIMGWLGKDPR